MYVRADRKIVMKGDLIKGVPQIFKPLIIGRIFIYYHLHLVLGM
jgi:hypothetical protein